MSSRAEPLQPAVEQARQRSEDALTQMASQQQRLAKAEQQLVELHRYRTEYAAGSNGAQSVSAMLNRQNFVERIDQAIAQQNGEIARLQRQVEQVRARWRQAHARESALETVVDRYLEEERKAADRYEQEQVDERSQYRRPR
ncbi:MAG: flagellar export protein FliJ [Pseudomonadota bacterium]|jgi:flagellar FliJ protein|nr:flagellar export protein FliJ [Xanthomonadaceae bacterium]MDE3211378.1 flagellar export protein FliJ [Pseudomonadota bacterium]